MEHLDEEVGRWTCLEYAHMRQIVGDDLLITNVSESDKKLMPQDLPTGMGVEMQGATACVRSFGS